MDKDSKVTSTTNGKAPEIVTKIEEVKADAEKKAEAVKVEVADKVSVKPVEAKSAVEKVMKTEDAVIEKKVVEETKVLPQKPTPRKKADKVVKAKTTKKKETVKKESVKKDSVSSKIKVSTYIQYLGKEIEQQELVEKVKENWITQGNDAKNIKDLELYVKPEEGAVYYVVNGIPDSGKIDF